MLVCPNCRFELKKGNKEYYCSNNHHFDLAKSGYLNLLLNHPGGGDNKEMLKARNEILEAGYFEPLALKIIDKIKEYGLTEVLDLGSGEGYYSRTIYQNLHLPVYGVDISKDGCQMASKLNKDCMYIVANIYDLPFSDSSFSGVLNIFAPYSPEIARITNNIYIKVVPSEYHLIELKSALYEEVYIKEEQDLIVPGFKLKESINLSYVKHVNEINSLFKMTPYYYKTNLKEINLVAMDVTFAFAILIYEYI